MKKIPRTILLLFFVYANLFGQGENNIWHINAGKAIDFNQTPPTFIDVPTKIFSIGPGTSVCDAAGNFLFHTNGLIVFNRLGEQMNNANVNYVKFLKASSNATMPTVVVPFPTDKNKYYVFSMNGGYNFFVNYTIGTLYYSILDMSLDNGLGDVLSEEKNTLLQENLTGRLIAGKGLCGSNWVIVHEFDSNRFFSFEVTDEGIGEPVISETGTALNERFEILFNSDGMMKFSHDYQKLVLFGGADNVIEVFDFDQRTGKLSNPIMLSNEIGNRFIQTGVFSPDNKKLYVIEYINDEQLSRISQFDFSLASTADIIASKTVIDTEQYNLGYRNMELGPDGVIYLSRNGSVIAGILSPNNSGINSDFRDSIFLFSRDSHLISSFTGLQNPIVLPDPPSIKDSILLPTDQQLCQNTQLTLQIEAEGDTYRWQDGSRTKDYEITAPGTYWVEVQKGNCTFTDTLKILPDESFVELGKDTILCQDERLTINVSDQADVAYQWQDGSTNTSFTVTEAGLYWVESRDSLCSYRDSVKVEVITKAYKLPRDTFVCENDTLRLFVNAQDINISWQDGSLEQFYKISEPGIYRLDGTLDNCQFSDTINVALKPIESYLENDTTLCNQTHFLLKSANPEDSISWIYPSVMADSAVITSSGSYFAWKYEKGCNFLWVDSITVAFEAVKIDLPSDTTICEAAELLLDVGMINGQLSWQDGSTDQQFLITQSGTYWASLTNDNCTASDSIEVNIAPLMVDLGQDTTLCENETLALNINSPNGNYEWQDGSQAQNYTVTEAGIYWAKITKDNCVTSDSILVNFTSPPTIDLGADTTLCIAETLTLIAPTILTNYQWQDGTTNNPQLVTTNGNYWLEGAIDNCTVRDSIFVTFETCLDDTQFCQAYLPNSFSPNGDGINDDLQLLTDCELQFFEMEVYDRWGSLVFSTTDVRQAWDGTANGELLDTGVYLWTVRYQFLEEDFLVEKVETVTVLR